MKLIFWQNCVSPHQLPYIQELYKDERVSKVILIAPVWEVAVRKKMGWENNLCLDGLDVIISPDNLKIESLLNENQENTIHLFSGIRADKFVYNCFKKSLAYNIKRGIITEPPYVFEKPLFLHIIRFLLFDFKYISKIDFVFGMGDRAVNYYKFWSKSWNVFLFGYCTESPSKQLIIKQNSCLRFVYVGNLIKRKNVSLLLKGITKLTMSADFTLDIIGDGLEFKKLLNSVEKLHFKTHVSLLGMLSMKEIHERLSEYNIMILPSLHDGWGAVINEGLQRGLYIISSDNCGAKTLIENSNRGIIFKNNDLNSLSDALNYCLNNVEKIKSGKQERILWSEKICGSSLSKYMVDCLLEIDPVLPPWKRD